MLREQVLREWNNLKPKIQTTQFSENDKQTWNYLANDSKLANFSAGLIEYQNRDLNQLEKEYLEISDKIGNLELEENDLVVDFWVNASSFVGLILAWIRLKKDYDDCRSCIEELEQRLDSGPTIEEVDD
jgi:hypothetical protein